MRLWSGRSGPGGTELVASLSSNPWFQLGGRSGMRRRPFSRGLLDFPKGRLRKHTNVFLTGQPHPAALGWRVCVFGTPALACLHFVTYLTERPAASCARPPCPKQEPLLGQSTPPDSAPS